LPLCQWQTLGLADDLAHARVAEQMRMDEQHRWGPCDVREPGGELCGCRAGVEAAAWPDFPDPT
jgi:hypothetical protein